MLATWRLGMFTLPISPSFVRRRANAAFRRPRLSSSSSEHCEYRCKLRGALGAHRLGDNAKEHCGVGAERRKRLEPLGHDLVEQKHDRCIGPVARLTEGERKDRRRTAPQTGPLRREHDVAVRCMTAGDGDRLPRSEVRCKCLHRARLEAKRLGDGVRVELQEFTSPGTSCGSAPRKA